MPDSKLEGDGAPQAGAPAVHRYDSFVVRVWTDGGTPFGRVQVRHVQSDAVKTTTMADWEWVGQAIARLMAASPEE